MAEHPARRDRSTVGRVVESDLCIGCGVCAGICPRGLLRMTTDARGCRVVVGYEACDNVCGVCESACPFALRHPDEDDLARDRFAPEEGAMPSAAGFVSAAYAGHVTERGARIASSSGGLATWLLGRLLEDGRVDAVACVLPAVEGGPFRYELVRDQAGLEAARGSRYHPVDVAEILAEIRGNHQRVAVVGLPCTLKGVARAMRADRRLREGVVCLVGLACGQMKSSAYSRYLAQRAGLSAELECASYRNKVEGRPAGQFRFEFADARGGSAEMDWLGEPSLLWTNHWFTPRACHFCDDLFAEVADVSFMDAWIPEFEREWMGTSLVAVRDRSLIDYFARDLYEPERSVAPIAVDELVRSQSAALADKREGLGYRLARALKRGEATPEKRIDPAVAGSALQRLRWSAQEYFAKRTLDAWAGVGGAEPSMRALAILRRELTVLDVVRRVMARFGS